jgi:hypothetical protein
MSHRSTPDPPGSENPGTTTQIAPSHGTPSQIRVEVTVLRADNVPKKRFRVKDQFFVTVTDQATTKKTASISIKGQTVQWNKRFDSFLVQPSAQLIFRLYAKRLIHPDTLIGVCEMSIPVESRSDAPFVLSRGDGQAGESVQPVTLYLSINVSAPHPILPINTTNAIAMSAAKNALHDTDAATKAIVLTNTWEGAVARIQWLLDTLSPVAGLNAYAQIACSLLLAIPKTLLGQFENDENVRTLLVAMHDAFDFANQEDIVKSIKRESKQA